MKHPFWISLIIVALFVVAGAVPQQQISGGGSTSIVQGGNTAVVSAGGALKVDASATTQPVSGTFWQATQPISGSISNTAFGISAGTANVGIVRAVPSSCTQSTPFNSSTVGVATGAGTSITSTTTCVTVVYVNNITNSAVTFRLQDKTGTPIIWVGGNGDFTVPANSNANFPLDGVLFTGGATAIAGTASALNLQFSGLQ